MGFFSATGRGVAWVAAGVVGMTPIKAGFAVVRGNWDALRSRNCPRCRQGRLYKFSEVVEGKTYFAQGCSMCAFYEFTDDEAVTEALSVRRRQTLGTLSEPGVRDELLRRYKWWSRTYLLASIGCLLLSVVLLLNGNRYFGSAALLGMFVLVRAFLASYRFWQIREDRLFAPGAFKEWFKKGAWIV